MPLSGMLNKHGGKVRLTFKLESDQLWLSTKERTEKLPMGSIKSVISEPIENHEEYHILVSNLHVQYLRIFREVDHMASAFWVLSMSYSNFLFCTLLNLFTLIFS